MIKIGNCGFVRLIDHMGNDKRIVNSARISYGIEGTEKFTKKDKNLLYFLMENKHSSPFEMVEFLFHVKAPLFVARQWIRHRTFSYNEISARYTEVKPEFFIPSVVRCQSDTNFQQSNGEQHGDIAQEFIEACSETRYDQYEYFVQKGVPREQARMILPQSAMTEFYCKGNLRNWLHFIELRDSDEAQSEIRDYAIAIKSEIEKICPVTMEAFHEFNGLTFSRSELKAIADQSLTQQWSQRKRDAFDKKMKVIQYDLNIPKLD